MTPETAIRILEGFVVFPYNAAKQAALDTAIAALRAASAAPPVFGVADPNDGGFGEAAYCHHRHHQLDDDGEPTRHSTDFYTCPHSICVAARSAAAPPVSGLEYKFRVFMWLNHGHTGLYGDDGEMQCSACLPFGIYDYKREPIEQIEAALNKLMLSRLPAPPSTTPENPK